MAEANTSKWNKCIPFVQLAYISKVHKSTKFSPYAIAFGKKMNTFKDWNIEKTKSESAELTQRAIEIKSKYEIDIPKCKESIKTAQERQNDTQNNQNPTTSTFLPVGQCVYVKCEGILSKLEPRYKGPYFVHDITSRSNYILKNAFGEIMRDSVPLHKIKAVDLVDSLPDSSAEVDKIVGHRIETINGYF